MLVFRSTICTYTDWRSVLTKFEIDVYNPKYTFNSYVYIGKYVVHMNDPPANANKCGIISVLDVVGFVSSTPR